MTTSILSSYLMIKLSLSLLSLYFKLSLPFKSHLSLYLAHSSHVRSLVVTVLIMGLRDVFEPSPSTQAVQTFDEKQVLMPVLL